MNVRCDECQTVYRVDPAKLHSGAVRARCSVCRHVFLVAAPQAAPAAAVAAPRPTQPHARRPEPLQGHEVAAPAPEEPRFRPAAPEPPAPARPRERVEPLRAAPPPRPATPARPAASAPSAPRVAPPAHVARPQPPAGGAALGRPVSPRPAAPPAAPARPAIPDAGQATISPVPARPAGAPRRPVNPFLVQDPGQKARRLARALVSDIVVYHPEKRRRGLAEGTLPALFEEEIRKSWEEYVEQVGEDLAQSTPHFTEALNEILAGGKQVF